MDDPNILFAINMSKTYLKLVSVSLSFPPNNILIISTDADPTSDWLLPGLVIISDRSLT